MNWSDIWQNILAFIGAIGGLTLIVAALATWIGRILADRMQIRTNAVYAKELEEIRSQYNTDLERMKGEISERRDLLNVSLNALQSGYSSSHDEIIESIDLLWSKILEVRELSASFIFMYAIMLPKEYENAPISKIANMLPKTTEGEFSRNLPAIKAQIEKRRPFIGEELWKIYTVYYAFALRLTWKVIKERDTGRIYAWSKDIDGTQDDHLFQVLLTAFGNAELQTIIDEDPFGTPQRIMDALETKMLAEMNELIFGRRLASISVQEQQRIASPLRPIRKSSGESEGT